jgi:glycosyltransferase involved in cell wall biosynthesis
MKIAFIDDGIYAYASGSPRAVGGAERDQWLLARALARAGWCAVVGVRKSLKSRERKLIDGVEYVGLGENPTLLAWREFLFDERPNWLFWECAYHLWGPLVEIAKRIGVRTIFHAACDLDVQPRHALLHRARWWPLYAWGLSRTDRIFVQHAGQLAGLSPRLRAKACILPKVSLPELDCGPQSMKSHYERNNRVAWVGTLIQLKRPDVLIEIARQAPDVPFVVCGGTRPGGDEKILAGLRATPNIQYLGQVSPATAQQIIADASLLLSTSDVEGFPNTFAQAWLAGTPVVSLKVDPGRVIVENNLGVVTGSAERAVAVIKALIESPDRRQQIGIRAHNYGRENYSAATVVKLFEDALVNK